MEESIKEYQKFSEPPFLQSRVVCGINALIEVLELPSAKLLRLNTFDIANKLIELSLFEKRRFTDVKSFSIQLQHIINTRCPNQETVEKVMAQCEEKFSHLLTTQIIT